MMKKISAALLFFYSSVVLAQKQGSTDWPYQASDSAVSSVSNRYLHPSFIHRLIMGKNYRKTWGTPVTFPVFYLSQTDFSIEKLGGGQQTKSLRLKDAQGRDWVLRMADKDVTHAIPKITRHTIVQKVVQDMVSASDPYGQLIVGQLSQAAGVIAPNPRMYIVADDPALGPYRSIFANTVCGLEQREPTPDNPDTKSTDHVLEKINEENDHLVLQDVYLKTRLMDMLIGDWDRHKDQWRWDVIDSADVKWYYAIPRDRDNAFFHSGGLLPFVAKLTFMPYISGFSKTSSNIRRLSKKAWSLDGRMLNELDADDWRRSIVAFQQALSDSVIDASVRILPPEVYALNGAALTAKLKQRRDGLLKNALDYYAFLSKEVAVDGTEDPEIFIVSGKPDGAVQVQMFRSDDGEAKGSFFSRTFQPNETTVIELNGGEGRDKFFVLDNVDGGIRLKINGGQDVDYFYLNSRRGVKLVNKEKYDVVKADAFETRSFTTRARK